MGVPQVQSDLDILDCLRNAGPMTVAELAERFSVTPTAIRQRLNRLHAEGLIERQASRAGRGRPHYVYGITGKGRQTAGANYTDLAIALWGAIRSIDDPKVRAHVLTAAAHEMARMYWRQVKGLTVSERMAEVARLLSQKRIPFSVEATGETGSGSNLQATSRPSVASPGDATASRGTRLPILVGQACPYPDLAEIDGQICQWERLWLSELLGIEVHLTQCQREGGNQCRFQAAVNRCSDNDDSWERVQAAST